MISEFKKEYYFLSNGYIAPFMIGGIRFKTIEHYMQYSRCIDMKVRQDILKAKTAGDAYKIGRQSIGNEDWKHVRDWYMMVGLLNKFALPNMRENLYNTGKETLIYTNEFGDRYWGTDPLQNGYNKLGKMLMMIRDNRLV